MSTAEKLLKAELPPRPAVLASLTEQMHSDDPDMARVSALVSADVGLGAAVVKTVNSPYFGLGRQVASVQQAVTYLGLAAVFGIVTGALLRRSFPSRDPLMERLWEDSARRGAVMGRVARELKVLTPDRAYTCGLFEHCGTALLLLHAPGYAEILKQDHPDQLELERSRYGSDHAALGQALVRTWGLPDEIGLGVRHHHDMAALDGLEIPWIARQLVALSVLANQALALSAGRSTVAWVEDAPFTARVLNLSSVELEQRAQELATALTGAPV
jgi:HD-like signal output (HDOD) protein